MIANMNVNVERKNLLRYHLGKIIFLNFNHGSERQSHNFEVKQVSISLLDHKIATT